MLVSWPLFRWNNIRRRISNRLMTIVRFVSRDQFYPMRARWNYSVGYNYKPLSAAGISEDNAQGPVSRKSRKLFRPEKPFVKLRPAYSVKLVFSYVVKGIKIKITAKFRASRRLRFEDTKRIMSPEKFRDFRETGPRVERLSEKWTVGWEAKKRKQNQKNKQTNKTKSTKIAGKSNKKMRHTEKWFENRDRLNRPFVLKGFKPVVIV